MMAFQIQQTKNKLEAERIQFQRQLDAERDAHVGDLVSQYEHTQQKLAEDLARKEREMKLERDEELIRINAERQARLRSIAAERQREEERLEAEERQLEREIAHQRSTKEKEFQLLKNWQKAESEGKQQSALQVLDDETKKKREEIAHTKAMEEESMYSNAEWKRYAADKAGQVITGTTDMKVDAIQSIEEKRMDVLVSVDERRTFLYVKMHVMGENLDEGDIASLDTILPDRSLFFNHGATAIGQIETQANKFALTAAEARERKVETGPTMKVNHGGGVVQASPMDIANKLRRRKLEADSTCEGILKTTVNKIQNIEKSERKRLDRVNATDAKAVTLLDKVISRGIFQPEAIAYMNKELAPTSALMSQATQDIANMELKADDSDFY